MEMEEGMEILAPSTSSLEAMTRGEIDAQVSTARRYPREVQRALKGAQDLALREPEECHYSIPRAGKNIEGPSIRLAEILATKWGNLRVATRTMDIGQKDVTVCAVAHDLESNVAVSSEVRRRITGKSGQRFSDDMIIVTANAAGAIAFRNVVFRIVPKALWWPIYSQCLSAVDDGKESITDRRTKAFSWFKSRGVDELAVLAKLGKKSLGEVNADDLRTLTGMRNAIREESSTIEDIFGDRGPAVKTSKPLNLVDGQNRAAASPDAQRQPGEDADA